MRIVYVLNSGQPGGVEQHVLDLVRGMIARGHEVFVVCPSGEMAKAYYDAGAKLIFDCPRIDIDPLYIFRLFKFLRKVKPEIFHVHQLKTVVNGLIAAKLASWKRPAKERPVGSRHFDPTGRGIGTGKEVVGLRNPVTIAHIHTPLSQWQIPEFKKKINIFVNRLITNWGADVVLALTKATKEERIKGEGIAPKKIVVIPNGVDVESIKYQVLSIKEDLRDQLGISKDTVLIGTLSRLTVEKGVGTLVQAVDLLKNTPYEIRDTKYAVLIAGTGELRESLEKQVQDLGVEGKITFLGFVPDEEKFAYLSALDIFVFPSLAEGFGISLIEAMACGCACLVSDLPVLSEVGGEAVESFKAGDADDLAKKLSDLVALRERQEVLGTAAKARVEKEFTMEKFWSRYEGLYTNLSK